ncbi:response regulator [Propionivibrio dicarboxylicus]|uniref:Two component transcriptional regulator, LuxR family n=1 Tax=Propionivibrio dicarboxylicus TaxID=83767 RepID=A0A1G7X413_9RHOO|nr:response regulator transcription factor [Propionivibrio dicarboxylicus]SDG78310.1 two component transcriptional regulator, LuxR family [Propionivibrio dicarboxylicus]
MLKLLIVEDHALVREGLAQTLRQLESDVTVLEAADCDIASQRLQESGSVDLMLLDLGLPRLDGLSYLATLHKRYPDMPVVILSAFDDAATVGKAMRAGAAGFVSKTYSSERLLEALREVLAGRPLASAGLALSTVVTPKSAAARKIDPSEIGLTGRQIEVLRLMAHGKSNRDIAALLGLSEGTVKVHMTAIFKALGVSSRTQAMVTISQNGIRL